jgi:hypothetical protein
MPFRGDRLHRRDQHAADEGEQTEAPAGKVSVEQAAQQIAANGEGKHQAGSVVVITKLSPAAANRQHGRQQQQGQAGNPGCEGKIQPPAVAADHSLVAIFHLDGAAEAVAAEAKAERVCRNRLDGFMGPGGAGVSRLFKSGTGRGWRTNGRIPGTPIRAVRFPPDDQ